MKTYKIQLQAAKDAPWVDCDRTTVDADTASDIQGRVDALQLGAKFRLVEVDAPATATATADKGE